MIYVAETDGKNNGKVRKISPDGVVTTVISDPITINHNGHLVRYTFSTPSRIDIDGNDNLLVVDKNNKRILKIIDFQPEIQVVSNGEMKKKEHNISPIPKGILAVSFSSSTTFSIDGEAIANFLGGGTVSLSCTAGTHVLESRYPSGRVESKTIVIENGIVSPFAFPIEKTLVIKTISGPGSSIQNGPKEKAEFNEPSDLAIAKDGTIYIADTGNNVVRKINTDGIVSTFAGSGYAGYADGIGREASFNGPRGIAVDSVGNVIVADTYNNRIRKITPSGTVFTLAGSGDYHLIDGVGTKASFFHPTDVVIGGSNIIYVADCSNNCIRKIDSDGNVSTIAGSTKSGYKDGLGAKAQFCIPQSVSMDSNGNLIVTDDGSIRKIDARGKVSTISGNSKSGLGSGKGKNVSFYYPNSAIVDRFGSIYVTYSNMISKVETDGTINPFLGSINQGLQDRIGREVSFKSPAGMAIDLQGNIFVADTENNLIRLINTNNEVSTFAGTKSIDWFTNPEGIFLGRNDYIFTPDNVGKKLYAITADGLRYFYCDLNNSENILSGADDLLGNIYLVDIFREQIVKIDKEGKSSIFAGTGKVAKFSVGRKEEATFDCEGGIVLGTDGTIYLSASKRILKISPDGILSVLAGSGEAGNLDGKGSEASFKSPHGMAMDKMGNIYVADSYSNLIRKVSPTGVVSTLAGSGKAGFLDGIGSQASFNRPQYLAVDTEGNVFVSDTNNHSIRKIDPEGYVSTFFVSTYVVAQMQGVNSILIFPVGNRH